MPEESKKNQHKGSKDQRRPRNRHQAGPTEKKVEKKSEDGKVSVSQKPVYEEPGPEFYKNLKRETEEILKITEEANSKYKKKEIQSNWSKYEMPIESYEEIELQENLGADYETLVETPLSIGGHFQFKHEKSWDVDTGPSLYDKYFEVNMDDLFLSIGTLPFHERINAEKSIFSETDMLTMNNRAIRFKQKYYNDKTFTTPELIVQDNILSSLKENIQKIDENKQDNDDDAERIDNENDLVLINESKVFDKIKVSVNNIQLENVNLKNVNIALENVNLNKENPSKEEITLNNKSGPSYTDVSPTQGRGAIDNFEAFVLDNKDNSSELETIATEVSAQKELEKLPSVLSNVAVKQATEQASKNPVIESPEDLEKWLDDFLDG